MSDIVLALASSIVSGRVAMRSDPPSGIASRALTTRFSSAVSNCWASIVAATGWRQVQIELDRLAAGAPQHGLEPADQRVEVVRLRAQRLTPRKREQLLVQLGAAFGRALRDVDDPASLRLVARRIDQKVEAVRDHGQQIVEIVRDPAGQLADRLHLLGLREGGAGSLKLLLGLLLLGHVAGDLGEAEQLSVLVEDPVDHDAGPEPRPVLAQPPAFALEPPLARGGSDLAFGFASGAVFRGEKDREMPPDDFVRGIALDPLAAEVPVRDAAFRIEHVDRVIGDALHQDAKPFLALAQRGLRADPLRHVAGDLGKRDQLAVPVADRVDHHIGPEARAVLAHAPALDFEPPGLGRGAQRALGHAGRQILRRIEAREMRADDLARLIPLDALGAGVPGRNAAVDIEQKNRIVDHALDQDAETAGHCRAPG